MKKTWIMFGMCLALVCATVSVQANELVDFGYLVKDVVGTPGLEMISPVARFQDTNSDGINDQIRVNFQVYTAGTTTKLFETPPKTFLFPPEGCSDPQWVARDTRGATFRGKNNRNHFLWILVTECGEKSAPDEIVETFRTYLYSTDVTKRNLAGTWLRMWPQQCVGWDAVDWDADGGNEEFMVTLEVPGPNGTARKVVMLNPGNGFIERTTTYPMALQQ